MKKRKSKYSVNQKMQFLGDLQAGLERAYVQNNKLISFTTGIRNPLQILQEIMIDIEDLEKEKQPNLFESKETYGND